MGTTKEYRFDILKLAGFVARTGRTKRDMAKDVNLSEQGYSLKSLGKRQFTAEEICTIAKTVGCHPGELFSEHGPAA